MFIPQKELLEKLGEALFKRASAIVQAEEAIESVNYLVEMGVLESEENGKDS